MRLQRYSAPLVLVLAIVFAAGCSTLTQAEIKFLETREMDYPYDEAYKAAANALFALGFTIGHSDKDSGILTGHRHDPRTGAKVTNAILFGVIGLAATQSADHAISFMLTQISDSVTQLRIKVIKNGKPIVDRKLMTELWQLIEREAMLETRPVTDAANSTAASSESNAEMHPP